MQKTILLLVASLLVLGALAGCSKTDTGDAQKDPPKGSVQAPGGPSGTTVPPTAPK
jgi:outer membrane protein assembly factor BamE (lipoprotein component of BamABCDE complex)